MDSACELVSSGIDWITCVTKDPKRTGNMLESAVYLARERVESGFRQKGWGMAGFSGFATSGVQFGQRNHEGIVRLSGEVSHLLWRKYYEMADSVTRLDVECTTRGSRLADKRVKRHWQQARRFERRAPQRGTVTLITGARTGNTLYLGKRSSLQYGRAYDKGAESKRPEYANCVRYEVEMKGEIAARCAADLYAGFGLENAYIPIVSGFFSSRGISFPLEGPGKSYKTCRILPTELGRLRWLQNQVQPTVRHLVACGRLQIVLDCLGLSDKVVIRPAENAPAKTNAA